MKLFWVMFLITAYSFILVTQTYANVDFERQKFCEAVLQKVEIPNPKKFQRRPLLVRAAQVNHYGIVIDRGESLPFVPGDWIVTEPGLPSHVMSSEEFQKSYEPISKDHGLYRKTPMLIFAVQVLTQNQIIERGKQLIVHPGDWLISKGSWPVFVLSNSDFIRVYEPIE